MLYSKEFVGLCFIDILIIRKSGRWHECFLVDMLVFYVDVSSGTW